MKNVEPTTLETARAAITNADWDQLMVEQMVHDRIFHPDISYMDNPHKVEHFALHFAKYSGRVLDMSGELVRDDRVVCTMCDTLAIVLGTAYALKMNLTDPSPHLPEFMTWEFFYARQVGIIAGGYLAWSGDHRTHMEDSTESPRNVIYYALRRLRDVAMMVLVSYGHDPIELYRQSLESTRRRHFAYEYLIREYKEILHVMCPGHVVPPTI